MKKILLIDDYIHRPEKGAPLFNMEREYLINKGYSVYTIGFSNIENSQDTDIVVYESGNNFVQRSAKFFGNSNIEKYIRREINKINPDVIHCHLLSKHALNVYKAIPDNIPVIQTLHGPNFFCPTSWGCIKSDSSACDLGVSAKCYTKKCVSLPIYLAYKILDGPLKKLLAEKVDFFHCPSIQIEKVANYHGFKNTIHIPLGVRSEFITKVIPHEAYGSKQVIFVGKMHPSKGVEFLISAFKGVNDFFPNARLLLAGTGDFIEHYKAIVKVEGLDKVINFLGFINQAQLAEEFSRSDLCIVPSVWSEQFGMVGPEALTCGVPVIGSEIGGIPEWLNKDYGWLVQPRNITELKNTIIEALSDTVKLRTMGDKARKDASMKYDQLRYCSELESLIESVV